MEKQNAPNSATFVVVVIEVGATRTKIGWVRGGDESSFDYEIRDSKHFMWNQENITNAYGEVLQRKGVQGAIAKIVVSCTGDVDTVAGVLRDGHALNQQSEKRLKDYPFVECLQRAFGVQEVYLINDGHGIGVSTYYWLSARDAQTRAVNCTVLSLGTHPALVRVSESIGATRNVTVTTYDCRNITTQCLNESGGGNSTAKESQTLSELVRKKQNAVRTGDKSAYTQNVITALRVIAARDGATLAAGDFIICGGLANLIVAQDLHASGVSTALGALQIVSDDRDLMPLLLKNLTKYAREESA